MVAHEVFRFAVVIVIERITDVTLKETFISRHGHRGKKDLNVDEKNTRKRT